MMTTKHVVTIDFETYFDNDYTLKKMPIAQYVFDARFEILGVGIKIDDEEPFFIRGGTNRWLKRFPRRHDWGNTTLVAHNAMFDALVFDEHFDIRPARYFCTMMAARPIVAFKTGRTSLKAVSEYFKLGITKGDELRNTKGKRARDLTEEDWLRLEQYCLDDVRLAHMCFNLEYAWFERNQVNVT